MKAGWKNSIRVRWRIKYLKLWSREKWLAPTGTYQQSLLLIREWGKYNLSQNVFQYNLFDRLREYYMNTQEVKRKRDFPSKWNCSTTKQNLTMLPYFHFLWALQYFLINLLQHTFALWQETLIRSEHQLQHH